MNDNHVILYATIRGDDQTRHIEASGPSYAEARQALDGQVPAGWHLLGIARWPLAGESA